MVIGLRNLLKGVNWDPVIRPVNKIVTFVMRHKELNDHRNNENKTTIAISMAKTAISATILFYSIIVV